MVRNSGKSIVPFPVTKPKQKMLCVTGQHETIESWMEGGSELRTVDVDFVDHILQLGFRRILTKRSHHRSKLLRRHRPVAIAIEQRERLLKLCNIDVIKNVT